MEKIVFGSIMVVAALICLICSLLQFMEKGFLMNNAYIYASKEERKTMDKKPHYRQSAIVFFLLGILFVLNALQIFTEAYWISYCVIVVAVFVMIYAIVSSVKIHNDYKKNSNNKSNE